jgi:hypothetical protein
MAQRQFDRKSLQEEMSRKEAADRLPKTIPPYPFPTNLSPMPVQFHNMGAMVMPMPGGFMVYGEGAKAIYEAMRKMIYPPDVHIAVPKKYK